MVNIVKEETMRLLKVLLVLMLIAGITAQANYEDWSRDELIARIYQLERENQLLKNQGISFGIGIGLDYRFRPRGSFDLVFNRLGIYFNTDLSLRRFDYGIKIYF